MNFCLYFTVSRLFEVGVNLLVKNNVIKKTKYDNIILFCIQTAITGTSFAVESKHMN